MGSRPCSPSPLEGRLSVALPTPSQTAMHCLWPPCRDPPHPPPRGGLRQPPHVFSPIPLPPERRPSAALPTAFKTARDAAVGRTPRLLTTTLPGRRPSAAPHLFSPLPPSAPRGAAVGHPPPPLLTQPGYPTSFPPPLQLLALRNKYAFQKPFRGCRPLTAATLTNFWFPSSMHLVRHCYSLGLSLFFGLLHQDVSHFSCLRLRYCLFLDCS